MRINRPYLLTIIVAIILVGGAYSNTYYSPFVLDDIHSFVRNSDTHVKELSPEVFKRLGRTQFGMFRFLPMATFGFDYWWGKGSVVAYHVTNTLIHILSWLACLWMLLAILKTPRVSGSADEEKDRFPLAAFVSTIWALHPVQTSAVTYLVQRMASMQAFFFMAASAAFVQGRISLSRGSKKAWLWGVLTALFSVGAFLSKENSAVLPIMFLVIEICFFRPQVLERLPLQLVRMLRTPRRIFGAVLIGTLAVFLGLSLFESCTKGYEIRHFTMAERLLTEARVVMGYVWTILVPNPEALSLEHDVEISRSLFSPPTTAMSLLGIMSLLGAGVLGLKSFPLASFGLFWFFLNLVIESTIVPLELKFDHRMYLPSVGLILAASEVVRHVFSKLLVKWPARERRKMAWSTVAVVCSFLSLMTFARNEDWESALTINQDAVKKAPNHPRSHANYASALIRAGQYPEALKEAQKAIELGRDHFEEHFVASTAIVLVHVRQGDYQKALDEGKQLLEQTPQGFDATALPSFLSLLGEVHRRLGNYAEAYGYAEKAIRVIQDNPKLRTDAPIVYGLLDRVIVTVSKENHDLDGDGLPDPGGIRPDEWLVNKLYELGDWDGAKMFASAASPSDLIENTKRDINIIEQRNATQSVQWGYRRNIYKPSHVADLATGAAYWIHTHQSLRSLENVAVWLLRQARALRPESLDPVLLEGWVAFDSGRKEEAVAKARQAVDLAPQSAKAWIALGFFEEKAGRVENALTAFRHTLELYPGYPKRQVLKELMAKLEASQIDRQESALSMLSGR